MGKERLLFPFLERTFPRQKWEFSPAPQGLLKAGDAMATFCGLGLQEYSPLGAGLLFSRALLNGYWAH